MNINFSNEILYPSGTSVRYLVQTVKQSIKYLDGLIEDAGFLLDFESPTFELRGILKTGLMKYEENDEKF